MDYIEIQFEIEDNVEREILIAELYNVGFESFEEDTSILKAVVCQNDFKEIEFKNLVEVKNIKYSKSVIKQQNWNEIWESDFKPVFVDEFVAIRAHFHKPLEGYKFELVITPKMSFGTGHHATTYLMIKAMEGLDFNNKSVLDFGTGTGVLAILAEKIGATTIDAIDYDEFCIENASENVINNSCKSIVVLASDNANTGKKYDIILANINKNIILDNLHYLVNQLNSNGVLLLSGLLKTDELEIIQSAEKFRLILKGKIEKDGWICLQLGY